MTDNTQPDHIVYTHEMVTDTNQAGGNKILDEFDTHISYPFPLDNGKVARLYMPLGITKNDVARIISLIEALCVEEQLDSLTKLEAEL